ncbi:MAG: hypothetical protein QCH31_05845 [Methanolobus sp.]|nr:hypothetical protein [Methanolobus sp.]
MLKTIFSLYPPLFFSSRIFLCVERVFLNSRVTKAFECLEASSVGGQSTLDRWF